jgi:hypothetical protein
MVSQETEITVKDEQETLTIQVLALCMQACTIEAM